MAIIPEFRYDINQGSAGCDALSLLASKKILCNHLLHSSSLDALVCCSSTHRLLYYQLRNPRDDPSRWISVNFVLSAHIARPSNHVRFAHTDTPCYANMRYKSDPTISSKKCGTHLFTTQLINTRNPSNNIL